MRGREGAPLIHSQSLSLTDDMQAQRQDPPKPLTFKYSPQQIESAMSLLEVVAKHSREYLVRHGEWGVCTPTQSVLLRELLADPQGKDFLGYLSLSP